MMNISIPLVLRYLGMGAMHRIAPLFLKLLFRNSLFGLGSVRFVALFLRW